MFRFLKNMLFLPLRTNIILHVVPAQAFKWHLKLTFTHSDISAQVAWISVFASTLGFVHSMSRMCYYYDFSIVGGIHSWSGCKEWCQPEADLAKPSWQDLDHGGWRRSVSSLQVLVYTVNIKPFQQLQSGHRVWPSIFLSFSDTICDLGGVDELANYGEYSGAPSEQQTYDYAKTILSLMTREKHSQGEYSRHFIMVCFLKRG